VRIPSSASDARGLDGGKTLRSWEPLIFIRAVAPERWLRDSINIDEALDCVDKHNHSGHEFGSISKAVNLWWGERTGNGDEWGQGMNGVRVEFSEPPKPGGATDKVYSNSTLKFDSDPISPIPRPSANFLFCPEADRKSRRPHSKKPRRHSYHFDLSLRTSDAQVYRITGTAAHLIRG
jgi:hypothetical protein